MCIWDETVPLVWLYLFFLSRGWTQWRDISTFSSDREKDLAVNSASLPSGNVSIPLLLYSDAFLRYFYLRDGDVTCGGDGNDNVSSVLLTVVSRSNSSKSPLEEHFYPDMVSDMSKQLVSHKYDFRKRDHS